MFQIRALGVRTLPTTLFVFTSRHYFPHISLFSSGFAVGEFAFGNWQLMILVTRVRSANTDPWSLDISLRWLLKKEIVKKPTWFSLRRLVGWGEGGRGCGWGKLVRIVNSPHGKATGLHSYMHYDKCKIRPFCWKGIVNLVCTKNLMQ